MAGPGETRASLSGSSSDETFCATCSRSFAIDASHCPHDGTRLVRFKEAADPMLGKVLDGRYEIQRALGEGGMGTVYRGMQLSVDRAVAIKLVHPSIATHREAAKRFLREARLASRLNSPHIVNVIDFGQSDEGMLFLVMELVKGEGLDSVLKQAGSLPPHRVVAMALQLCDALEAAHSLGIVHRDLKPGNVIVIVDTSGREILKVLDFGLAKSVGQDSMAGITNTNALLGTPLYMAPEQIEGAPVDARTDLYALGCMLFEMLTGAPPFNDSAMSALFAKHLHEPPPRLPPNVPPELQRVVFGLLEKLPGARIPSARALRDALYQSLTGTPAHGVPLVPSQFRTSSPAIAQPAHPQSGISSVALPAASPISSPKRRFPLVIGGVALAAALVSVALVVASRGNSPLVAPAGTPIALPTADAAVVVPNDAATMATAVDAAMIEAADASVAAIPPDAAPDRPVKPIKTTKATKPVKTTKPVITKPEKVDDEFLPLYPGKK